jgi:hypothetical protein
MLVVSFSFPFKTVEMYTEDTGPIESALEFYVPHLMRFAVRLWIIQSDKFYAGYCLKVHGTFVQGVFSRCHSDGIANIGALITLDN